jgi:RimJ/RimL family protein N-acetyltransferase
MFIQGEKVSLKLIQQEDIELIRNWRNSKDVSQHFIVREYISKAQQKKWFEKKSTSGKDYYFLIVVDNEPIGLIFTKNIDWDRREAETGIFIAKKDYRNSLVSFEASLLHGQHFYEKLNLIKNKIQVLESNEKALRFNKRLGFKEIGKKEVEIDGEICKVVLLELTRNDYDKYAKGRERLFKLLSYK